MIDLWNQFIGQYNLKKELRNISKYNVSLLLRGNSGYGKTLLARVYCSYRGKFSYQLASDLDEGFRYDSSLKTHIIDEVHELKRPEILYPIIDSGVSLVLCTNETSNLKEPLRNRCIERFLEDYSLIELIRIVSSEYPKLPSGVLYIIANRCRGIPRVAKQLAFLCEANTECTLDDVLKYLDTLGVYEDGFSKLDRQYLSYLKDVRIASLSTIKSNLNIPETQIKEEIEPFLIRKRLISISSKGRKYEGT